MATGSAGPGSGPWKARRMQWIVLGMTHRWKFDLVRFLILVHHQHQTERQLIVFFPARGLLKWLITRHVEIPPPMSAFPGWKQACWGQANQDFESKKHIASAKFLKVEFASQDPRWKDGWEEDSRSHSGGKVSLAVNAGPWPWGGHGGPWGWSKLIQGSR
jgi:hypothetical protein